jgi:subtilisin
MSGPSPPGGAAERGTPRPAWSRDSMVVRLPSAPSIDELTPSWAWEGATGAGVRVAVVDSGIDADHPGLHGCVDVAGGVAVEVDAGGRTRLVHGPHGDSFGHGTACAGIIHDLAPAARITSVKVLGASLGGSAEAFLAGLRWAVDEGFDIVNLSLGCRRREWALAFHEVCDRAYFAGTFVTAAASNVEHVTYPSLFSSVASVAANLASDPFRFHHNPEPPTEFLARGIDVEVLWRHHGRVVTTGNSFAAPHIAGIAALVLSKHPGLRPFHLKTVLWATSANVMAARAEGLPELARDTGSRRSAREQRAGRLSRVVRSVTSPPDAAHPSSR